MGKSDIPKVPEGWKAEYDSNYEEWYYVNLSTGDSQWVAPVGTIIAGEAQEDQRAAPPAEQHPVERVIQSRETQPREIEKQNYDQPQSQPVRKNYDQPQSQPPKKNYDQPHYNQGYNQEYNQGYNQGYQGYQGQGNQEQGFEEPKKKSSAVKVALGAGAGIVGALALEVIARRSRRRTLW